MLRKALTLLALAGLPAALDAAPTSAAAVAPAGRGHVLLTTEEALELAFPECRIERDKVFLTKQQRKRASEFAGDEVETAILYVYSAWDAEGGLVGYGYFDTHEVRTKRETILVALTPDAKVRRVEVLAFAEPREYLPRGDWYGQFAGQALDGKLRIKGDIQGVSGATLTAHATVRAVRRNLALHAIAFDRPPATSRP